MSLDFDDPRVILVLSYFIAIGVGLTSTLVGLYVATYKVPLIHQYLNRPGAGGPAGKTLDANYDTLRSMGVMGKHFLCGLYFFYLVVGKNYYWHRGRRHGVKLATETVPIELKR